MILFPNAKINLGLYIISKRSDGFHNIETLFLPYTDLYDVLEIVENKDYHGNKCELKLSGNEIPGNKEDNLIIKAYNMLDKDFELPPTTIYLHKNIPTGGGLGGGSSDATFSLLGFNELFHLNITEQKITEYANRLGSDCAFFVKNKPAIGTGRGEILKNINLCLHQYKIKIVTPPVHISTSQAYKSVNPKEPYVHIIDAIKQPISQWKDIIHNDFEPFAISESPIIEQIKQDLYAKGALYASMSGSGSSVFGIFEK